MKFIFIVAIVSAFLQSLSCDCIVDPVHLSPGDDDQLLFVPHFEYDLEHQFLRRSIAIVHSWRHCNETYSVRFDEAIDMFQNPPLGDARYVTKEAKCLVDCTMRRLGVMTDNGLDEEEYMVHIKQLRYNYTTYDINERSSETKQKMLDTILKRAGTLPDYEIKGFDFYGNILYRPPKWPLTDTCYDLIRSYTLAAQNCKTVKDPKGDDCETSFMTVRCMMEDNRKRAFNSPFYPVQLKTLQ